MSDFTPEQETRIRQIIREELKVIAHEKKVAKARHLARIAAGQLENLLKI